LILNQTGPQSLRHIPLLQGNERSEFVHIGTFNRNPERVGAEKNPDFSRPLQTGANRQPLV
jgi:hypothetical protein